MQHIQPMVDSTAVGNQYLGSTRTSHQTRSRLRTITNTLLSTTLAVAVAATSLFFADSAQAAETAFNPSEASIYVSSGAPTQLYKATNNGSAVSFNPLGGAATGTYNAISYNTADNFLYGIQVENTDAIPRGALVRIASDGTAQRVGTVIVPNSARLGTFGPDGYLYVAQSGNTGVAVINTATGRLNRRLVLSQVPATGDWTMASGFFWGVQGGSIYRTNPLTGQINGFPSPLPSGSYGANWTYGNGNLGFVNNDTGELFQVQVTDPSTAPRFKTYTMGTGPASSDNDGAASPGLPTDLAVKVDGPATLIADKSVKYTVSVTNQGPGDSSGFIVADLVPEELQNIQSSDTRCTVDGNNAQCIGGFLAAGSSTTFTITATAPSSLARAVVNTATVTANEQDVATSNDSSSTTGASASVTLKMTAGTPIDVNDNGITDVGDRIPYSYVLTNSGQLTLTSVQVDDPSIEGVACPVTVLDPGASITCSSVDTVTTSDATAGEIVHEATASGVAPNGDVVVSSKSSTTTAVGTASPRIELRQTADVKSVKSSDDQIVYTLDATNTGNVPIRDVDFVQRAFTGYGTAPRLSCVARNLAVGESTSCTATYTATQSDIDRGSIVSTVVASGTPAGGARVTSAQASVEITSQQSASLAIVANASRLTAAKVGSKVAYNYVVTNTGNVTLSRALVVETAFARSSRLPVTNCFTASDEDLAPSEKVACTATYVLTQSDIDRGEITAEFVARASTPASNAARQVTSQPSNVVIPISPAPILSVSKIVAEGSAARVGQRLNLTFHVVNTGNVSINNVRVSVGDFSGSGVLGAVTCPAVPATVSPGQRIVCEASYVLTSADLEAKTLSIEATATGTAPDGSRIDDGAPFESIISITGAVTSGQQDGFNQPVPSSNGADGRPSDRQLAFTGADLAFPVGLAVLLAFLGLLLLALRRGRASL